MKRFLGQKGQTSVELLLIIVVAITIGITFKKRFEEFMLKSPNSFITRQLRSLEANFSQDGSGRYRTFTLR